MNIEDKSAWVYKQIDHIRAAEYHLIDAERLITYIETLLRSEKRALKNEFITLICYLIKWNYAPSYRSRYWISEIYTKRANIYEIIENNSLLENYSKLAYDLAWQEGRRQAMIQCNFRHSELPKVCPWTYETAMTFNYDQKDLPMI